MEGKHDSNINKMEGEQEFLEQKVGAISSGKEEKPGVKKTRKNLFTECCDAT